MRLKKKEKRKMNKYTTVIAVITVFIIFFCNILIFIYGYQKYYNNKDNNNNNNNNNNDNCRKDGKVVILYEGEKLFSLAKKRWLFNNNNNNNSYREKQINCNSNLWECKNNRDCKEKCKRLGYHKIRCISGLCRYFERNNNNSQSICQNGGRVTSTFMLGRFLTSCLCTDNFIGLYCQIPNEMKSLDPSAFQLTT